MPRPLDIHQDLVHNFRQQVNDTPNSLALQDDNGSWTYRLLDDATDLLAYHLRHHFGVERESLVGILMTHHSSYVVACLAVLKAGGAYLVLETAYPPSLLADVIADARPCAVLVSPEFRDRVPAAIEQLELPQLLSLGRLQQILSYSSTTIKRLPDHDTTDLDRLAFVSYSSGSTGKPKGICNSHRAALWSYSLRFRFHSVAYNDRVACNVFFVWEMLRPLLCGGTVVSVPDEVSYDPVQLVSYLTRHVIHETLMTPTLLSTILSRFPDPAAQLPTLHVLWLNGEVVPLDLARRAVTAFSHSYVQLFNCYSVSETHEIACGDIDKMLVRFPDQTTVCPVGRVASPVRAYILDENRKPVPFGNDGELFVGGDLLARGYLNKPELTADVFLPDPFSDEPGARMYRTGDKARFVAPGILEVTGRVGNMIKLRGYTVHPAAVESAIVKNLAVRNCIVVADGDGVQRQLVAYVVLDDNEATAERPPLEISSQGRSKETRRILASYLAPYMIPAIWIALPELPTHKVSCKVDVKALPRPPSQAPLPTPLPTPQEGPSPLQTPPPPEDQHRKQPPPPKTVDAASILSIWAVCLNTDVESLECDMDDLDSLDFFDVGGHSLALAELSSLISVEYGVTVPLLELVRTPTLVGHVVAVAAATAAHGSPQGESKKAFFQSDLIAEDNDRLSDMMMEDCHLLEKMGLPDFDPTVPYPRLSDAMDIFLTGATGFFGAFLLAELVKATSATIHCLVRAKTAVVGMRRLRKHLFDLGLDVATIAERIQIIPGNLAQPRLGLPTEGAFAALGGCVQAIVHAGAQVNLLYPYSALRNVNVVGTAEILRLACYGKGKTALHYVSTNGVLPPKRNIPMAWTEEDDPISTPPEVIQCIPDGYGQTKWVAEYLVSMTGFTHGWPFRVYRLGTLGGDSLTGASNARDVVWAVVLESLRLGYAPAVPGWRIEMTPVDVASSTIVKLACMGEDVANKFEQGNEIYHIGDPEGLLAKELFVRLARLGYETQSVTWDEWVSRWSEDQKKAQGGSAGEDNDGDLSPTAILRAGMPSIAFLKSPLLLDDSKVRRFLGARQTEYHVQRLDLDLLTTYTRYFYSRGWLEKAPTIPAASEPPTGSPAADHVMAVPRGPLAGRVAVVVGASSGIGSAIARALASDGAQVALGARRIDALKEVQASIEGSCPPGIHVLVQETNVVDAGDVKRLIDAASTKLGGGKPVDILVVCAGVMYYSMMANGGTGTETAADWDRTVDVNCKGLLHCLSAVVPGMLAREPAPETGSRGHIVAISSDAGRKVFPGLGVYSGSKFFVEAVLQSLRLETAGKGLRVTSVQPGNTATDLLSMSTDQEAIEKYGAPSGAKVLSAADVASAVMYALRQPAHVAVNEVLIEPRDEPI